MEATVNKIPMSELDGAKEIGRGAFSTVYQMTWTRQLGTIQVAAKRINKPEDDKELKMLSRLDHPNVIKLLGVVDEGINFLLVLELCDGGSLRSYLNGYHENRLPTDQFFDWATSRPSNGQARGSEYTDDRVSVSRRSLEVGR